MCRRNEDVAGASQQFIAVRFVGTGKVADAAGSLSMLQERRDIDAGSVVETAIPLGDADDLVAFFTQQQRAV